MSDSNPDIEQEVVPDNTREGNAPGEDRADETENKGEWVSSLDNEKGRTGASADSDVVAAALRGADWIRHVPVEFAKTAAKYRSFGDFIKAHGELQSKLGQALFVPSADAGPEDVSRFRRRLGQPKAASDYQLPDVEGVDFDQERVDGFRDAAFAAGLTQAQFADVVKWEVATASRIEAQAQAEAQRGHKRLAETWGEDAPGQYEKARRVVSVLFNDDERQRFNLNDEPKSWPPDVVAAMARISPSFAEDRHVGGNDRDLGRSEDRLLGELDRLQGAADYYNSADKQRRAREISERLWGTGEVARSGR